MEHLLMQIFDRKKWIEGQLRHQFESYGESLAYNVLAEGKQPPLWLWSAGSDGCGFPDPKGRLFSVPCTATPSANNSTYFTLPAFKGYEVSRPNNFTEPCVSEYVFSECRDKVVHSANKLNPDRMAESEVLACAQFVPLDSNQHSNSKQTDEEICPSENEKSASHLGKSMNKEESGRVTRSRAHSWMVDDVRESSCTNISLHHQNADGGRVTRSRSRFSAKAGHLNQLSKPLEPLDCIVNRAHEVVEKSDMPSVPSINLNHLSCTISTRVSGTVVGADNIGESSALIPSNDSLLHHSKDGGRVTQTRSRSGARVDSLDKLSEADKSDCIEVSRHKVVESRTEIPSVLNFNHLQTCITGSAVLHPTSHVHSSLKIPSVQPIKLLFDGNVEHGLNKNSGNSCENKNQQSSGTVFTNSEAVSVNKELHCCDNEKVDGDDKDFFQISVDEGVRSSNCGRKQEGRVLLEVENSRSHSYVTPGDRNFSQDINRKNSLEMLAEEKSSKFKKLIVGGVDYMPAELNSQLDPQHPARDSKESEGLALEYNNSLEKKVKDSSRDNSYTNMKVLEAAKEAYSSCSVQAHSSLVSSQRQEDVLPTVELTSKTKEANVVLGQVLEERVESSEVLESESISLPGSNHRDTPVSAPSYLNIRSISPTNDPACSALDAACVSFSGHQVFISEGCKKSSFRASTQGPIEENNREKIITETSGRSIETTGNVQHAGSALPSQTDDVHLEVQTAAVGDCGNSNSSCYKISGSCKFSDSVLPLNNTAMCLSAQATGDGNSTGTKGGHLARMSRTPRTQSSQHKVPYLLRSSTSLAENHDCMLANGSVSCSKKNSMLPPDINAANPDQHTKNIVNCSWITPNSTKAQGAQKKSRYFLRNLDSHDWNVASFRLNTSNASHLKQPVETIRGSEISWPKRRKVEYGSNNILATSPRFRFKHSSHIQEIGDCSSNIKTAAEVETQPIPMSSETETGLLDTVSRSPKPLDQSKKHIMIEGYPYMKWNSQIALSPLPSEHVHDELLCEIADRKSGICLQDETRVSEARICKSQKHSHSADCPDSLHETRRSPYGHEEQCKDKNLYDTVMGSHVHDTASFPEYYHAFVGFDENMPEFEGFSIACPSVVEDNIISNDSNLSSLAKERACAIGQLCKSKEMHTPLMCTSLKYKVHKVPDVYKSLPAGVLEDMNTSSLLFNDANMKHVSESDNEQLSGIYGHLGLEFDGSFVARPYSLCLQASSVSVNMEARKPPLTPQIMKSSQVVSCRSASSEKAGSNPELVCFRIDENSSIDDENGSIDELDDFKKGISLREGKQLSDWKALRDITAEHQNKPILGSLSKKFLDRGSLDSVNSEVSTHLSPAKGYAGQHESKIELKETTEVTANRGVRKAALFLCNKSNKPRLSAKINERSRSHGNLGKEGKPSNVVSNVSSFIPRVHQKQQAAAPLKGRKEIKIKALEAAEVAKHLEERKQNEREMRKAAAKQEREKLEQEKIRQLELKQKPKEEERKKKEAEIAARKRQREEGRKEKGRKRRCTEEIKRQKGEQEGKIRADRVERELRPKASDEKEHTKEPVDVVKAQLKPEKIECQISAGMQPSINKSSAVDDRNYSIMHRAPTGPPKSINIDMVVTSPDHLQDVVQTRASISKGSCDVQSYEMSPFRDSDDEEDGEEEIRRERKHIPLWARRECLDEVIRSTKHLDPVKIFSRKENFIVGEVLRTANLQRPF